MSTSNQDDRRVSSPRKSRWSSAAADDVLAHASALLGTAVSIASVSPLPMISAIFSSAKLIVDTAKVSSKNLLAVLSIDVVHRPRVKTKLNSLTLPFMQPRSS